MRLILGSVLSSLFCACPPPTSDGCVPKPGLGFPTSVIPGAAPETVVATAGTVTIAAPSVTCIPADPNVVTVVATLAGAGQPTRRVPATITLSSSDFEDSKIEADLSTLQPGEYSLQIFVEPTIAALNIDVIIALDRTSPPTPRLEPSCSGSHGRTSLGTSICVDKIGSFEARLPDGGALTFPGTSVTLARNVLWIERSSGAGAVVERHLERSPGQFERTHVIQIDGAARVDAADEQHVWAGTTFATTSDDGGSSTQRTANADQARLRMIEEGRGLEFSPTDDVCEMDGGCWSIAGPNQSEIANVSTKHVWLRQQFAAFRGLVRPLSAQRVSAITTHSFPQFQVHAFSDSAFRLRAPASLVLVPSSNVPLFIERGDGLFERWEPQRGWSLRDATDFLVAFDTGNGQTAVFLR